MRSRIFAKPNLEYKRALELALALEAAERHAGVRSSNSVGVAQPGAVGASAMAVNSKDVGYKGSGAGGAHATHRLAWTRRRDSRTEARPCAPPLEGRTTTFAG
ncbi:hypothetical protein EVAR_100268_1 [Eumeta japonica]|uniref:Uncharacterized protein n=1 Tax=Eumeta variegata TaxID=151549 RepID=A0A4C1ZVI0_EUMVA|nr:hypothetical protein EVAR_100268_1 [Eumeta japonica]